ncbi:MAG: carbamate kinase [Acidobacteriota bacterium]|nr:carbamate kinase [Acidobacteriota bacterium]MDH3784087.1 carbamate kinase [Acidobacteriota bacterium]
MNELHHDDDGHPLALIAMGGHAFMTGKEAGTIDEHVRHADQICEYLMSLVERDFHMVVTHGNGPQVGNLLLQNEMSRGDVPEMPLDVLVAMTEGSLGYVLQQSLLNQLRSRNLRRYVVTMVTQVRVDAEDPAFDAPTKPIGPFLPESDARRREAEHGWIIREDPQGRGWRRLVPSPQPRRVIQRDMIRGAARDGHIVVACGGGGIPIVSGPGESYHGIEAVVDKDLTSSVLATNIGADLLIILTAVPQVYVNFGKPDQRALSAITLAEIEQLMAEGHFPAGSMGPKIQAVIDFLRNGGKRALITDPATLPKAIDGRGGSHFIGKL